jgi:uncharacterized membrane protein YdjX (TVP38/TMEM64 family)
MGYFRTIVYVSISVLIIVVVVGVYLYGTDAVVGIGAEHRIVGAVVFSLTIFSTTVVAPLSSLPLVPVLAPILGPFTTGLACFVGWTLGAVVAFLIGRYGGRPLLERRWNLDAYRHYEKLLSTEMSFVLIVALRMVIPVDVLSYALGVMSTVSLPVYTGATMVGIFWFSFAFAYFGDSLVERNYVLLAGIGVASVTVLVFSFLYIRYIVLARKNDTHK